MITRGIVDQSDRVRPLSPKGRVMIDIRRVDPPSRHHHVWLYDLIVFGCLITLSVSVLVSVLVPVPRASSEIAFDQK